jgi:hypothetical protein
MCGDLDEEDRLETALYARFRSHAKALLSGRSAEPRPSESPSAYMDRLFADALTRCLRDTDAADESRRYELLAAQPVVFARLAGFLAGHASLRDDPLRRIVEAMMYGYAEAGQIAVGHGHDHDHDGEHHHGHPHPPGHHHH